MKQTAVEWLYNNLKSHFEHDGDLLEIVQMSFEQAKEMEKEQIENAYQDGWMSCEKWFADKELDDHIADTNETFKSEQ
jgi:hypothetical protein